MPTVPCGARTRGGCVRKILAFLLRGTAPSLAPATQFLDVVCHMHLVFLRHMTWCLHRFFVCGCASVCVCGCVCGFSSNVNKDPLTLFFQARSALASARD